MTGLQQGANAGVSDGPLRVALGWTAPAGVEADASAYLLTADGRVRDDADMVFYNQPSGADGAVRFSDRGFDIDPARVPAVIERIVFCVTIDGAVAKGQTLAMLADARIAVGTLDYAPTPGREAAMIFGELYRRQDAWKFRAVGQGFDGGLAPLARSFGIDVAEDAPAPPPAPPAPVRLSKVSLDKPGQTVSLEKKGASFGEIVVNLNWSRGRKGFFGGTAIDLDLGCLIEMRSGEKGVVQALGRVFGAYDAPPFVALSGDDRTGDIAAGETLRINGARWSEIVRVAIFANIYAGAPNWQATDGVVSVTMPDQPPIEVRMSEGRNDRRLCGVVLIENDAGRLKATRIVDYFRDQKELDERLGWGLRWVAGRKD